jgi:uncharacterized protein (TIGR03083 family)
MTGTQPAPPTRDQYLGWIRRDGEIMAAVPEDRLGAPVPSCPEWDVAGLHAHTGWVHRWVTYVAGLAEGEKPKRDGIASGPGDEPLLPWFRQGLDALLDALGSTSPDKAVFTLAGVQPASWWLRRIAHETAMHRWDLQSALGEADPFDPALAADGIDELFDVMLPRRFDFAGFCGSGQTLHLHGTDGECEWLVAVGPDSIASQRGHEKADVAVRGPLGDLFLLSWNRVTPADRPGVEVFGDADLLARFQQAGKL